MESNGNQRKRAGRTPKILNAGEKTAPQNSESTEVIDEAAVAISPTLDEFGSAPPSECRRSSRKKIIKFDVRDLLNKNRKTHKIQIEARIDSNAPSTSKAANIGGFETVSSKSSSTASREDLLSKHKTFLEKSAIFRRYSVSQEHKAPPPPLPIPPLLGKANEKDSSFSGTSSCQEFLSHAMTKPKQPTSLIVAQIESNKPSIAPTKRKNVYKSLEMYNKTPTSSVTASVVQQKKRGRPAKNKGQTSAGTIPTFVQEDTPKKKITPEKAKNWKEYKACLAQQSNSNNQEKIDNIKNKAVLISDYQKIESPVLVQKHDVVKIFDDTLQSDLSRSDDDGNFSGFQTSKDDVTCDSPVLEKLFPEKSISVKNVLLQPKTSFEDVEPKSSSQTNENQTVNTKLIDKNATAETILEKNRNRDALCEQDLSLIVSMPEKVETKNISILETEDGVKPIIQEENKNENMKNDSNSPNFTQKTEIETQTDVNKRGQATNPKENGNDKNNSPVAAVEVQDVQVSYTASQVVQYAQESYTVSQEIEKRTDKNTNQKTEYISCGLTQECIKSTISETENASENFEREKAYITTTGLETDHEVKVSDNLSQSSKIVEESTSYSKQTSTSSDEAKSFSCTSSSSESENAFERSSYSSEPFSTTSSSSPRSYKSGDKLKVSIKRIPLPKSPSTSSQTSTSEEFTTTDVLKSKPPMAKRSRRLQKISKEGLANEDADENIDDCFKSIVDDEIKFEQKIDDCFKRSPNCDKKSEQNTDQEICIEDISKSEISVTSSKSKNKEIVMTELKTKDLCTSKDYITEIIDTLSAKENVSKRKSLRSRKEYSSYTKDDETDNPKRSTEKEKPPEEIERNRQEPPACGTEEDKLNFENSHQQETATDNQYEMSLSRGESDKLEYNEQDKIAIKFQSAIDITHEKLESSSSNAKERGTFNEHTNIVAEIQDIETDNEDKLKMQSDSNECKAEKTTKDALVSSVANEEDIFTKQLKTQSALLADLEHKEPEMVNLCDPSTAGSVSTNQDVVNKITPTYSKNIKDEIFISESQNDEECLNKNEEISAEDEISSKSRDSKESGSVSEIIKDDTAEKSRETNKSLNQKLSRLEEKQVTKIADDTINETSCRVHSTQQDMLIAETVQVHISECNQSKTSDEQSIQTNKETTANNKEIDRKTTAKKQAELSFTEAVIRNENDNKLKVISANYEAGAIAPEIMDVATLGRTQHKTINSGEMATLPCDVGESKKVEISETAGVSKTFKEELSASGNQSYATEISSGKIQLIQEYSSEISKNLEDNLDSQLLEGDLDIKLKETEIEAKVQSNKSVSSGINKIEPPEQISSSIQSEWNERKTLAIDLNISPSKKTSCSPKLSANSIENMEKSTKELDSSTKTSLESLPTEQPDGTPDTKCIQPHPSKPISTKVSPPTITTKTDIINYEDSPKLSQETNLSDKSQETQISSDTIDIRREICVANTQENPSEAKNETSLVDLIVAKRRGRKPRFKNLHFAEFDLETDSSNTKSTSIDEISYQKLKPQTKTTQMEIVKDKEIQSLQILSGIEEKHEDVLVKESTSIPENSQTNLLSSQIKNVSIETNTLLDILRTVQSNTEAALKATKSPTDIDTTDNEQPIESTIKMTFHESKKPPQDLLEIQQEHNTKITSPVAFDNESSLAVKKQNLSPSRSDSGSPFSLKKVTPSPTRSNSSSPLTLKKVTRRYERRSRRGEDSGHKTLEETFAEIAAQSSKAVLAAKEFDINDDQSKLETCQKQPDVNLDVDKEQHVKGICTELQNTSELGVMSFNTEESLKDPVLNVSEELDMNSLVANDAEMNSTESTVEIEMSKLIPAKRGRKPKNRPCEFPMTEAKEKTEVNSTPTLKEDSTLTKEVTKVNEFQSEAEIVVSEKIDENKTIKCKNVNESPESTEIDVLPKDNSKNALSILSEQQESANLLQTHIEESLKQLEDVSECKLSKKIKKRDTKTVLDEEKICQDKEDDVLTPKQPIKKRDSSSSKSETKSVGKKVPKKTKNEEEDSLHLQKEETLTKTTTTTPQPSKRGRKPKNQQPESLQTCSKKKNKKDICTKSDEEDVRVEEKPLDSENESLNNSSEKSLDEKLAKKKRQKKLKEAFEAALTDDKVNSKEAIPIDISSPTDNSNFSLTLFKNSPPPPPPTETAQSLSNDEDKDDTESLKLTCMTPVEPEEDLDPLKDIEKFIADGVNLLKKDYKVDEDSVDDVMQTAPSRVTKIIEEPIKIINEEAKHIFNTFETPADTPIHTPSVTPPPKSPSSVESITPDEQSGVRRSHRIKLITKTPKALVGRGLVRDRERFSIKDDVETKSHYTMDDHLTDLAEVEAKNAKFLKEMEERLSNFNVIKENDYLCERVISREARKMICDCFLTHEEEERGELGCGEDCLNRLLMIECGSECNVKERCTNKRFQKLLCSPCRVFRTEKKGFGIMADIEILPGEFIMEYVGEVIDTEEFEKRRIMYSQDKNRHYYFMALRSDAIIDATIKGNISRFINHSCDPNAETQKWTVNGELRIGFFSRKSIMPGEEITFNYQYQRYGREAQRCYCESANCRGWIGQEPTSDEGEQMDDEDDESEDEEDTSNLLVHDDDDDSDTSVADPEEVQKQLEMAAAQAEVELAPLQLLDAKVKQIQSTSDEAKSIHDINKSGNEEDSKSKFKKLLSKMAEKVAAKQKQNKREQKLQRKKKSKESSSELKTKLRFLEDPDIEDEVEFLRECGLKNQSDTLRLSRLMVRAKLVQTRLNLLEILRKGDLPCRRLFLDYHGLRLLHGWMSEDGGNMQIRLSLLQTLETLPIANKTILTDSKVMQAVRIWCGANTSLSPNEDSSSSNSNSQEAAVQSSTSFDEGSEMAELQKLALKLITTWDGLPEIFRIPKKERIEQMKEHEREADRQYAANAETLEHNTTTDRYRRDRFGRGLNAANNTPNCSNRFVKPNNGNPHKTTNTTVENLKNISKAQRREMFAAKVARDEAEKRLAEERREFETKCRFFGLDPKKTRPQDIPFCVNPSTGQWFSIDRKPIPTPPSYAHVQVPIKPKSTDPNDYQLPAACSTLPPQWKYAITPQGKIYYYHIKNRISQWEAPSSAQLQQCELEDREEDSESEISTTAGEDSSDDDDDILIGMDSAQLKAYIDRKVESRRQKRYQRLVDQRSISPRREEDRIYNQLEVRKYKENKEKIRKRKEDIRRKRVEALRQTSQSMCTLGSITDTNANSTKSNAENDGESGVLPIQDYLLSSDEEVDLKAEVTSPLMDKIVEGDKIVDELDALTSKKQLKRPLPPHRDFIEPSTSLSSATPTTPNALVAKQEYKKRKLEKKEKRKPKEQDAKYRKNKEKFRCEIAGIIVHHLKPYLKETCSVGRIQSNEDFNHLARKLTHFVMIKELKYCESVGQTLVVTESVKSKSREFIKKYMAKYGDVYIKPNNDPDFKDIPFTL